MSSIIFRRSTRSLLKIKSVKLELEAEGVQPAELQLPPYLQYPENFEQLPSETKQMLTISLEKNNE